MKKAPKTSAECGPWPGAGSRWQSLQAEIDDLDTQLAAPVTAVAPTLLALPGVGVETAEQLLVTAGEPRPPQVRGVIRPAVRGRPDPGVIRAD
jgi:hypothetical protein